MTEKFRQYIAVIAKQTHFALVSKVKCYLFFISNTLHTCPVQFNL